MQPSTVELVATIFFACAILHTFAANQFNLIAARFPQGSMAENTFHLLGEIEVVFGFWGGLLILAMGISEGQHTALEYVDRLDFTEPMFVFVILAISATQPVLQLASVFITGVSRLIPMARDKAFVLAALIVGPLLGSFITEPAAMTVTALLLKERVFDSNVSLRIKYLVLGALFVNVSVGGVLTPFAAPPVLMVAGTWKWDFAFMFSHFGWKAIVAVVANACIVMWAGRNQWAKLRKPKASSERVPAFLMVLHLAFLGAVVMTAHHSSVFMGIFFGFLGLVHVTQEYQTDLKLKESLLVSFFLAGLIVLGTPQQWWLEPILMGFNEVSLFLGAAGLTAITDNAALTYLGAQVPGLSEGMKYALVAGAVAGGGLTVIANAPNPAGYSILLPSFEKKGFSPLHLFLGALIPTISVLLAFWFLPHLSL